MKTTLLLIFAFGTVLFFFQEKEESIKRLNRPYTSKKIVTVVPQIVDFKDSIPNDTLYEYYSETQIPIMFSRKIVTEVCIDTTCRILTIELFWNITGRYLGFELPSGEFLSKTEHAKFNDAEYDQLHLLLADPQSELANYTLKELVPKHDSLKTGVDAVSSATIKAVLNYIVKGAVYTTYTLWHTVYGPTKREIEKITTNQMNPGIAAELLESPLIEDRIWALNHFPQEMKITDELQSKLLEFISGNDVYICERSLNALNTGTLNDKMQLELVTIFENTGFLQQRLILQKFKDLEKINPEVIQIFASNLNGLNGSLTKMILELFNRQNTKDESVAYQISGLLKNENRYISNLGYKYLQGFDWMDKRTIKNLNKYEKKLK